MISTTEKIESKAAAFHFATEDEPDPEKGQEIRLTITTHARVGHLRANSAKDRFTILKTAVEHINSLRLMDL